MNPTTFGKERSPMTPDALISVIVPVYQVEPYLPHCIESLLQQTYRTLEILLIDDGSPDRCGRICEEYAARDARIRVFHIPNGGVSAARNHGIRMATGRYLTFVDSDDFVSPQYVEALYRVLQAADADLAICAWENVPEKRALQPDGGSVFRPFRLDPERMTVYTRREGLQALLYQQPFNTAPWSKLYKRELFETERFPLNCCYEDFAVMPRIFNRADRLAFYPYPGYGYVLRRSGITLEDFSAKKMQLVRIAGENEAFVLERYPDLLPAVYSRTIRANLHIYSQIPLFQRRYAGCRREIAENVRRRRRTVLLDRNAHLRTKLGLCMTFAGVWTIRAFRVLKAIGKT